MSQQILVITCGLQCSGKSTKARQLSSELDMVVVSTDKTRRRLIPNAEPRKAGPLESFHVYYVSLDIAEEHLSKGRSVVIDGTFSRKLQRMEAYHRAEKAGAPIYVIECICPDYGLVKQRYASRKKNSLFKDWENIECYHHKFQTMEPLERECLPSGQPVPIIRYNSANGKAEIMLSDGSENIEKILEVMMQPEKVRV